MKKLYFLLILFIAAGSINAQTPTYSWAKFIGGPGTDFINGIAVGTDGNPVVIGNFSGDTLSVGDTMLFNYYNAYDMFIIKYDENGNTVWVTGAGGTPSGSDGNAENQGISTDANGNFYFTGEYNDSVIFNNNVILPDEPANQLENSYTVKFNSSGTAQWARRVKGAVGQATSTDQAGNVAMAGLMFFADTLTLIDTAIVNPDTNGTVSFIIKYDENGNRLWQQVIDGAAIYALATDKSGDLYASGALYGALSGDSVAFGSYTLVNSDPTASTSDIFLVKYSPAGTVLWAEIFGGVSDDVTNAMNVSSNNDVNITGNFDSPQLDFGSTSLTNPIGADFVFVTRLDSSGTPLWAQTSALDNALGIASDGANSVFISGDYLDTTVIIGTDTLSQLSPENIFVAKYDASGNFDWAQTTTGTGAVTGCLIANDANGNSYIAANFQDSTLQLGNTLLTPVPGEINIAVAKLDNTGAPAAVQNVSISGINVYPNPSGGTVYITGLTTGSQIEIYNLLGEEIYSATAVDEIQQINLNAPAKGMYIYKVTSNNATFQSGKIVIE